MDRVPISYGKDKQIEIQSKELVRLRNENRLLKVEINRLKE